MISCGWFGEGKGECALPQGHRGVHAFDCRECNGKGTKRGKMFNAMVRCVRCDGTGIEPTARETKGEPRG
jgi:DnaJ-class molecular chaperone